MSWVACAITSQSAAMAASEAMFRHRIEHQWENSRRHAQSDSEVRRKAQELEYERRRREDSWTPRSTPSPGVSDQPYNPFDITTPMGQLFFQQSLYNSGAYDSGGCSHDSGSHSSHSHHHDSSSSHSSPSYDSGSSYDSSSSGSFDSGSSW